MDVIISHSGKTLLIKCNLLSSDHQLSNVLFALQTDPSENYQNIQKKKKKRKGGGEEKKKRKIVKKILPCFKRTALSSNYQATEIEKFLLVCL